MAFSSPIWLLFLLPWAVLTLWLLWGRPEKQRVPFLELWRTPDAPPRARRGVQVPPLWLAAAILAMLLGILGAAGPTLHLHSGNQPVITIILDRGLTSWVRRQSTASIVTDALGDAFGPAKVNLIQVPGDSSVITSTTELKIQGIQPALQDTSAAVASAINQRLAQSAGPIILLSDKSLSIHDPRLLQIHPEKTLENVGIVQLAMRDRPLPQLMVRLQNQSAQTSAVLLVLNGTQRIEQKIQLPPHDSPRDYFIDIPNPAPVLAVRLQVQDDLPQDNQAWLLQQNDRPSIEPLTTLPPELSRMIDVYQAHRSVQSRIAVMGGLFQIPKNRPAVGILTMHTPAAANIWEQCQVRQHPITKGIDFKSAIVDASMAGNPGDDWQPLVTMGDRVLLAVRDNPVRQVWVGFYSLTWPRSADYVMFWTNVFDWVGQGNLIYTSYPIDQLDSQWKPAETTDPYGSPGIYRNGTGALRAFNLLDVKIPQASQTDWRTQLAALKAPSRQLLPLRSILLVLALAMLALAAASWKKHNLTPSSTSRTV